MEKTIRKLLAMAMALMLVVGMLPASVYAENNPALPGHGEGGNQENAPETYPVTYAIEGGSFAQGTVMTENVINGEKPANVPTGMTPDNDHKATGAWYQGDGDTPVDPAAVSITDPTIFTWKFEPKPVSKIKTKLFVMTGPTVVDPSESAAFGLIITTEDDQYLPADTVKASQLTLPPQATLDLDAEYNAGVVELPASALSAGANTLSLSWAGDESYEGCSATVTFTVANKQSLRLVEYAATLGKPGEPYTISGRFLDGNNQPLADTEITIRTQQEPGSTSMLPWFVDTDKDGRFSYTVSQNLMYIHEGDTLNVELIVHATDAYLRFEKTDQLLFVTAPVISPAEGLTKTYDKEAATLSVENATAYPPKWNPVYQWYKDGSSIEGANGSTYTVKDVSDSGAYKVAATVTEDGKSVTLTSDEINVAINAKDSSALTVRFAEPAADHICDGNAHEPEIIIKDGETIVSSDNYAVAYGNNVNVSTQSNPATAMVSFRGNYTGAKTLTFEIKQLPSRMKVATIGDIGVNKEFAIEATLTDEKGAPLCGREIFIFVNNIYLSNLPKTDANGKVTVPYTPNDAVTLNIRAVYPSLSTPSDTYAASEDEISVVATQAQSVLKLKTYKNTYIDGEDVTISGKLEDGQGRPISDAAIALSVNGKAVEADPPVMTDANGEFSHTFKADAAGAFMVKAKFDGIGVAIGGSTDEVSFDVVHDFTHHAKVDATCEQDGTEEYWQCEGCGKYYSDAEGQTEISGPVTLNKLGHDWGEWTVTKEATAEEEGERIHSCMREGCGKTETEVIPRIRTFTISFDAGGGSGQMASVQVAGGEDWQLPQSTFTHPQGKAFKGWSAGGSEYQAGQKYTPTDDITFTALWSEAKYTGPSGIHYVEVGDSKTFTYKANEGWFYQVISIEGLIPEALQFLSFSGINGKSGIESDMSATEFTVTFAPTYFPEGSETMGEGDDAYTITHCETIIRPNIFWRNTGVGDYAHPIMDKFVVVPGRTSIELNKTKLVLHPGDTFTLVATATPKSLDVTFTPGNNGVVSVDENGVVTALRLGKDTVTVSVGGDGNYLRSEAVVEILVVERADLSLDPVASVEPDGNVTISGRLLDKDGKGIGGQTIKIRANPNHQGEDLTNEYCFPDVQTAEDGSFSAVGSWKVPDQFILEDFDVTVSLDSESFGCDPKTARVSVVNPTLSVTGSIVWDDGDNIDGRRPEKTWLLIRRTDGDPVLDKDGNPVTDLVEIAGTKGTKLSATWENLPTHADIGGGRTQRVSYKVIEADQYRIAWTPGGYEKLASGDMESGFIITNRYIPLQTDIVVKKVWEDDGDAAGKRPESVALHVDQARPFSTSTDDDIKDVAAALTADETGGWKAAWRGLPYRQKVSGFSTEILYSVREDAVKNYAGRLVQTNVGRRASIVWADGISEEDKPASITATLVYVNGDATSRTAVLNEANNWTCEFTGLPEHMAADYNVSLFPGLQPELGYLQHAVVWGYTLTNTLIPTVELTIDVPQCGTVVDEDKSYPFNPADGSRGPEAQSNRPVGTILTSGWEFVKSTADPPAVDWLKWGPFTNWNENPTMVFPITLTGGSSYNALGRIVPAGGAPVPAAFSLVVNGQELSADRFKVDHGIIYFAASIEAEHTLEKQARVEPTCTATGTEEHWKCTVCGKLYSDENGANEIAEPAVIEKLAHTPGEAVRENEVPASCETEGSYDEVVCCTECKEELSREKKTINALGHDWSEWIVTKDATETEEGIETRTCGHDASHTETRPIPKLDPANVSYHNTAGNGSEWTKGSKDKLVFAFKRSVDDDAAYDLFSEIRVDGKTVPQKDASGKVNWTAKSGSVVIDLEPSFLETLSVGKHTLIAVFEDGSGAAEFTISQAPAPVTLTGIKLSDDSAKKIYTEGEALDVTGLTLEVEKSDGSKEAVDVTAAMVTGFDSGKIGKQILTVTYEGFTATCEIEVKAKTDVPAVTYSCTNSDGTWTKGSTAALDFTFNRSFEDATTFAHFTGIKVDGKDVAETQYDAASGSVIIKLKPSFLETLSIGKHTLRAEFDDGSGAAEFTIEAKQQDQTDNGPISPTPSNANTTPKTGDGSNAPLWIWLMAISMGVLLFAGNRRRHTE